MTSLRFLKILLGFIALFHLVFGAGLMFSVDFQRSAVELYGATITWTVREIYFVRIIGSFAFILGTLACVAAQNPLANRMTIIAFIEFFILRNICRHLFADELYIALGVSPLTNTLTSIFFGVQAILLGFFLWRAQKAHLPWDLSKETHRIW